MGFFDWLTGSDKVDSQSTDGSNVIYNRGGTKDFGIIKQGMLFKHIADLARWGYVVIGSQLPGNSLSEGREDWGMESVQAILDLYPIIEVLSTADHTRIGMHGTADWRVSPLDSIDLASKLYEHKRPFQLIIYGGGDHGLSQYTEEWQVQAKAWFDKRLK